MRCAGAWSPCETNQKCGLQEALNPKLILFELFSSTFTSFRTRNFIERRDWWTHQSERQAANHWWLRRENLVPRASHQSAIFIGHAPFVLSFFGHSSVFEQVYCWSLMRTERRNHCNFGFKQIVSFGSVRTVLFDLGRTVPFDLAHNFSLHCWRFDHSCVDVLSLGCASLSVIGVLTSVTHQIINMDALTSVAYQFVPPSLMPPSRAYQFLTVHHWQCFNRYLLAWAFLAVVRWSMPQYLAKRDLQGAPTAAPYRPLTNIRTISRQHAFVRFSPLLWRSAFQRTLLRQRRHHWRLGLWTSVARARRCSRSPLAFGMCSYLRHHIDPLCAFFMLPILALELLECLIATRFIDIVFDTLFSSMFLYAVQR